VEGLVGYARRNFMVPVPRVTSWEELNGHLLEECRKRRERKLWGQQETIAQRFERDREKLLPLPATPYEACEKRTTCASSQALVRYETNDYSVPVEYEHRQVLVKAFVWELVISHMSHPRPVTSIAGPFLRWAPVSALRIMCPWTDLCQFAIRQENGAPIVQVVKSTTLRRPRS
jgi:hypothetical protein